MKINGYILDELRKIHEALEEGYAFDLGVRDLSLETGIDVSEWRSDEEKFFYIEGVILSAGKIVSRHQCTGGSETRLYRVQGAYLMYRVTKNWKWHLLDAWMAKEDWR